jgi:hypothetical protein
MKQFFATLAAILVAAAIIFAVKDYGETQARAAHDKAVKEQIEPITAALRAHNKETQD